MYRVGIWTAAAFLTFLPSRGYGELVLTAEVTSTIGLPGFDTYRITATSDLGNVVGFDFSEIGSYGIFGPINQVNPFDEATIFRNSNSLFGANDPTQDTQFLIDANDVASVFTGESDTTLHGVFAFLGDKQLTIGNSVPFLQITTAAASEVLLKGAFAILRPNNQRIAVTFEANLADILIGPAPSVEVLPVPDPLPEPVIPPPPPIAPELPPAVPPDINPGQVDSDPPPPDPVPDPVPDYPAADPTPDGTEIDPVSDPFRVPTDIDIWRRDQSITIIDWRTVILDGDAIDRDWTQFSVIPVSGAEVNTGSEWPVHAFHGAVAIDGAVADFDAANASDTNLLATGGFARFSAVATDNVAATSVPEPASVCLLLSAQLGFAAMLRRNRLSCQSPPAAASSTPAS